MNTLGNVKIRNVSRISCQFPLEKKAFSKLLLDLRYLSMEYSDVK